MKYVLAIALILVSGCSMMTKRSKPDAAEKQSRVDQAASELSLRQLDQAYLVFRVAFDKSLETWAGPSDDVVTGCKISGKEAENGLVALKPWLERRAGEEAKRAMDSPKNYQLPIDVESCERDCSCGLGLKILESANLDDQSYSKTKDLKRTRARLEAKSELMTSERAELCAEGSTWICGSDLMKALKGTP